MLSLLLAVATVDQSSSAPRVGAPQPAVAVVRIVRGAEIRFATAERFEASIVRRTEVRERDGSIQPASLIEFY